MTIILSFMLVLIGASSAFAQELFGLENSSIHKVREINVNNSTDPDVKKALKKGLLRPDQISYHIIEFRDENKVKWRLQVFENLNRPGPTFFVPHDNENDAFQVGSRAINVFGGHLISLECKEKRTCYRGIDPNRYFDAKNRIFSTTILRFYKSKSYPVITLHNNHDSHRDLGGEGAIYSDMESPYEGAYGFYHSGDPDDLIIFSDREPISESYIFRKYFDLFQELGLNSIFEEIVDTSSIGGHMSNYVLLNTNLEYFNVESEHGHEKVQYEYLSKLLSLF